MTQNARRSGSVKAVAQFLAGFLAFGSVSELRSDCKDVEDPLQILDFEIRMDPVDWDLVRRDSDFEDEDEGAIERPATFRCGDEAELAVRVRRKRFAALPSEQDPVKVSLKIDFDDGPDEAEWHGRRKLSLENGVGGTLISECLAWLLMAQAGVITSQASWVRLHVNGKLVGVYTCVEQIDKSFLRRRVGDDEGFLYKNESRRTREGEIDPFVAKLCYTPFFAAADRCPVPRGYKGLEDLVDLHQLLGVAAVNAFTSNWDSLFGTRNNYWWYNSERPRRYFPWDIDLSMSPRSAADPVLDPHDLSPGGSSFKELHDEPRLRALFDRILRRLIDDPFRPESIGLLLDEVAEKVIPAIGADPLSGLQGSVHDELARLRSWIRTRHDYLDRLLPTFDPSPVVINEVLAANSQFGPDEKGNFPDWIELLNRSSGAVSLEGLFLTDDPSQPLRWPLPNRELGPGERILVWCDGDTDDGALHAGFVLDKGGEAVGLSTVENGVYRVLDFVRFGPQEKNVSIGRFPDGSPGFVRMSCPTPLEANVDRCEPGDRRLRRGDSTGDGKLDIADAVAVLGALFLGQPISCADAGDANDDGALNLTDPIAILQYLFLGGDPIPPPAAECGVDPTADELGCEGSAACP